MATGKVKTLYSDKEKSEALFPRTKTSAISDANGVGLDALMENILYSGTDNPEAAVAPIDADTLGGIPADDYATENFVQVKIAEAQMSGSGGDIDLSGYATKDDVKNLAYISEQNQETATVPLNADTLDGKAPSAFMQYADQTDYIVEQGTSGSWTYRKWNSGIAECWGTHKNIAVQGHATYGSIIYAGYGSVYLPSIFTEVTNVNQSCFVTTGYDWCGKVMVSGVSSLTLYPMSGSAISTGSKFTAYIHVHGRWK